MLWLVVNWVVFLGSIVGVGLCDLVWVVSVWYVVVGVGGLLL